MSDPWIKVFAADMRGDPGIRSLSPAMRYALIQAWDLAKNGPGKASELRANDGRAMRERELRDLANVAGAETRRMFERWRNVDLCELVDEDGVVLCTFPNLAKRQGIDETAADRKRRERERKRHANVTAMSRPESRQMSRSMSRHVTAEKEKEKRDIPTPSPSAPKPRDRDPIWDAFAEACGQPYEPMPKAERGKWNAACKQLREIDVDPADIVRVAKRLASKWGGRVPVTPSAIVTNWGATLGELNGNGHRPARTAADFDRLAAAQEEQRRAATKPLPDADPEPEEPEPEPAPSDEGVPY